MFSLPRNLAQQPTSFTRRPMATVTRATSDGASLLASAAVRQQEVQRLSQKIKDLEAERAKEQHFFSKELNALEQTKRATDQNMKFLQEAVASSNQELVDMKNLLDAVRLKNEQLRGELREERTNSQRKADQARDTGKQLKEALAEKDKELAQVHGKESVFERKNKELGQLLRSAQMNVEETKKERESMLRAILRAIGKRDVNVSILYHVLFSTEFNASSASYCSTGA